MTLTQAEKYEAARAHGTPLFADLPGDIDISFEFFPPKTPAMAWVALWLEPRKANPPMAMVTVALDAGEAARWMLHCHHMPHLSTGMMTEFAVSA